MEIFLFGKIRISQVRRRGGMCANPFDSKAPVLSSVVLIPLRCYVFVIYVWEKYASHGSSTVNVNYH